MTEEAEWCFAWFGDEDEQSQGRSRAAAARAHLWQPGAEIFIAYQDNDADSAAEAPLRERVERYAPEWMTHANVTLTFVDNPDDADIRISFRHPGSWSTVGTTCRTQRRDRPTMNFNGSRLRRLDDEQARGVILHEFGHALGLIHEHQHPETPMQFRRTTVIREVSGPPNFWDEAKIARNIFDPANAGETNSSAYDRDSIMMYPIPPHWLEDPEQATGTNYELSPSDVAFIATQYPKQP